MFRWLTFRLATMVLTLLGITLVTFVVLDQAPVDRAEIEAAKRANDVGFVDPATRDAAVLQLRIRYGMVDPNTLEPAPVWQRWWSWLENAVQLRFAGPHEDHAALLRRLSDALPVSMLLGGLALLIAFGIGIPLGARCGMRPGSRRDRVVGNVMFGLTGVPEFLLGMLLVLGCAGAWRIFPSNGFQSDGAEQWSIAARAADFAWHLVLPVTVMAVAPLVLVTRFVRDSVARATALPFAASLRALGADPRTMRRRLLRNALAPVATLVGSLLPMLVGGSLVVENLFSLDGIGHLAFAAVLGRDQGMVMAIVVLTSVATLSALLLSDVLQAVFDPRVRLGQ